MLFSCFDPFNFYAAVSLTLEHSRPRKKVDVLSARLICLAGAAVALVFPLLLSMYERFRVAHAIMTTFAFMLALLPLAFALGLGAAMQQPLAIAIISGLAVQMPLVLLMMPVIYALPVGRRGRA